MRIIKPITILATIKLVGQVVAEEKSILAGATMGTYDVQFRYTWTTSNPLNDGGFKSRVETV